MTNPAAQLARMRRKETKLCAVCGKKFTAVTKARFCSEKCKKRAKRAREKDQ